MRLKTVVTLAVVFLIIASTLPAQWRRGRAAPRGAARPPAGRGHATASQRSRARSVYEKGDRKRTGRDVPWVDRPVSAPVPVGPADPEVDDPRRDPKLVEQERVVLAHLDENFAKLKTLTFRGYLSVKPKGRATKRVTFDYFGSYDREANRAYHRFTLKSHPPRRIIIHEQIGGTSEGWLVSDMTTRLSNPMTTPLLDNGPAIVLDALPLEPARYHLGLEGEGNYSGSAVWYLAGARRGGRGVARIAVRKSLLLPVHAQVFKAGQLTHEVIASRLELSGGVLGFNQRRVTSPDSTTRIDLVCRDKRVNGPVSMDLFAKPE